MKKVINLSILIAVLSAVAAAAGLFYTDGGQAFDFTTIHGQVVKIFGDGLYKFDSSSIVAQTKAQDALTLFIAIPLLIVGIYFTWKRSFRGRMLLTGLLGYFLYTYASMSFAANYNPFFLIYVALFSLSLFAFILAMMELDINEVNSRLSSKFPRTGLSVIFILCGIFFLLAWGGGRVLAPLMAGTTPDVLEHYTTLVIQVLDLGLMMPVAFLSAYLLLARKSWGVPLATVFAIKSATLATAVSMMGFNMLFSGAEISMVELIVFPAITIAVVYYTVRLFLSMGESKAN
ncbi:MAG: hypothetical protein AB9891_00305 [Anaerolineaceae bacterium]